MILSTEEKKMKLEGSQDFESMGFGIQEEDVAHIIILLRQKLYKNPIDAICREVSSNSRDANREVGLGDVPVTISLKDSLFLNGALCLEFGDQGPGIGPSRMREVFINYGASTKRSTNEQTGGFGLGAKTPFAYTSSFTIETVFDQKRYIYLASVSEGNKGRVTLLLEEEAPGTPSGTKISVPIKDSDVRGFIESCYRYTLLWDTVPEYHFGNHKHRDLDLLSFKKEKALEQPGFYILKGQGYCSLYDIAVDVDGVPYPLEGVGSDTITDFIRGCRTAFRDSGSSLLLKMGVGEISLAPSRETLHYDEKTIKALEGRIASISSYVKDSVERLKGGLKRPYEILSILSPFCDTVDGFTGTELWLIRKMASLHDGLFGSHSIYKGVIDYDKLFSVSLGVCSVAEGLSKKPLLNRKEASGYDILSRLPIIVLDRKKPGVRFMHYMLEEGSGPFLLASFTESIKRRSGYGWRSVDVVDTSRTMELQDLLTSMGLKSTLMSSYSIDAPKDRSNKFGSVPCRYFPTHSYRCGESGSVRVSGSDYEVCVAGSIPRSTPIKDTLVFFVEDVRDTNGYGHRINRSLNIFKLLYPGRSFSLVAVNKRWQGKFSGQEFLDPVTLVLPDDMYKRILAAKVRRELGRKASIDILPRVPRNIAEFQELRSVVDSVWPDKIEDFSGIDINCLVDRGHVSSACNELVAAINKVEDKFPLLRLVPSSLSDEDINDLVLYIKAKAGSQCPT